LAQRFTLTVYLHPTAQWYRPMLEKWQAIEDNYGIIRKLQLTKREGMFLPAFGHGKIAEPGHPKTKTRQAIGDFEW
jgi:hypothetical protein